jgi:hypothetical protein
MQESLKTKQGQLAFSMTNGADAKEQLADVRNVLSADRVFLSDVKLQCQDATQDFEVRVKDRQEELDALAVAVDQLSGANQATIDSALNNAPADSADAAATTTFALKHKKLLSKMKDSKKAATKKPVKKVAASDVLDRYIAKMNAEKTAKSASLAAISEPKTATAKSAVEEAMKRARAEKKAAALLTSRVHKMLSRSKENPMAGPAIRKVIKEIEAMLVTLKAAKTQEVRLRDTCNSESKRVTVQLEEMYREQEHLNGTKIAEANVESDSINQIALLDEQWTIVKQQRDDERKQREEERDAFMKKTEEHREAQALIMEATTMLRQFYAQQGAAAAALIQTYGKGAAADKQAEENEDWGEYSADSVSGAEGSTSYMAFLQTPAGQNGKPLLLSDVKKAKKAQQSAVTAAQIVHSLVAIDTSRLADTPIVGVNGTVMPMSPKYKKSAAAGGVIGILEMLHDDVGSHIKEDLEIEERNAKQFELSMQALADSESELKRKFITLKQRAETAGSSMETLRESELQLLQELEEKHEFKGLVSKKCDFLVANFDMQQEARTNEIETLKQAKFALAGMNFS